MHNCNSRNFFTNELVTFLQRAVAFFELKSEGFPLSVATDVATQSGKSAGRTPRLGLWRLVVPLRSWIWRPPWFTTSSDQIPCACRLVPVTNFV